jgi:hypothetical protein
MDLARAHRLATEASARLSHLIVAFPSLLLPQHAEAPVFLLAISTRSSAGVSGGRKEGSTLLPELMETLTRDVHSIYASTTPADDDGVGGGRSVRVTHSRLLHAVERMTMIVRLLYVLASPPNANGTSLSRTAAADGSGAGAGAAAAAEAAPVGGRGNNDSTEGGGGGGGGVTLGSVLQQSSYSGLVDRFVVALGTIAFADVPEWATTSSAPKSVAAGTGGSTTTTTTTAAVTKESNGTLVAGSTGAAGTRMRRGPVERVQPRATLIEMACELSEGGRDRAHGARGGVFLPECRVKRDS